MVLIWIKKVASIIKASNCFKFIIFGTFSGTKEEICQRICEFLLEPEGEEELAEEEEEDVLESEEDPELDEEAPSSEEDKKKKKGGRRNEKVAKQSGGRPRRATAGRTRGIV